MTVGVVVSRVIGFALMALMFYSSGSPVFGCCPLSTGPTRLRQQFFPPRIFAVGAVAGRFYRSRSDETRSETKTQEVFHV
jgi:hypothetical protein